MHWSQTSSHVVSKSRNRLWRTRLALCAYGPATACGCAVINAAADAHPRQIGYQLLLVYVRQLLQTQVRPASLASKNAMGSCGIDMSIGGLVGGGILLRKEGGVGAQARRERFLDEL